MSNVTRARQLLHHHGQHGNWRFKGLLLAGLKGSDVTARDMALAWPKPKDSDYRFLQSHPGRDPDAEMSRTAFGEEGTDRHRVLKDYALNAGSSVKLPKRLQSAKRLEEHEHGVEARLDDAIPRMLFASDVSEEVDTLFREQLLEVVMEGREFQKVAREAADVINVDKYKGDVPIASDEQFAPPMARGSEIRDDAEAYTTVSYDTTKHGEGARVDDELRNDAMVDVIERNIRFVGASVENAINRVWLRTLVDDAANTFDTAGSNQGYQALNETVGVVDGEGFQPDSYATTSSYRTALYNDTNLAFANRAGTNEVLRNREDAPIVGDIAGLDMHASTHEDVYQGEDDDDWPAPNNTFDFKNDGDLGAVVYDRDRIHLFMYAPNGQDIEIKDYDDPIRDLNGVNARVHVDCRYSQARSAATIQF